MEQLSFRLNGLEIAALAWPGDGLPVIALHGWLDNAASFIPLAELLRPHHLLALDLPGHGHSDHLPAAAHYHLADNIYLIRALADAMGWERFVLLGHSMGAAIASLAAAAMPRRVIALSLIDGLGPLAFSPEQEVGRMRELFSTNVEEKPARPFKDLATASRIRQRHSRFAISAEAATLLVERNLVACEDGYRWRYDERLRQPSSHYYSEEQVRGILASIERPFLLLSAEQGALAGWSGFASRREILTGLKHEVLPGGHHLHMEAPELVAGHLQAFYQSLGDA